MPEITFKIVPHSIKDVQIVEILIDGVVCGVIYPQPGKTIKLASAHIKSHDIDEDFSGQVIIDDGNIHWPPIPSVTIRFDPSPYTIVGNKIIKQSAH